LRSIPDDLYNKMLDIQEISEGRYLFDIKQQNDGQWYVSIEDINGVFATVRYNSVKKLATVLDFLHEDSLIIRKAMRRYRNTNETLNFIDALCKMALALDNKKQLVVTEAEIASIKELVDNYAVYHSLNIANSCKEND